VKKCGWKTRIKYGLRTLMIISMQQVSSGKMWFSLGQFGPVWACHVNWPPTEMRWSNHNRSIITTKEEDGMWNQRWCSRKTWSD
jgi:hypothetical protein